METPPSLCFPPFSLAVVNEQFWQDEHAIELRHKTCSVRRCLVEHTGQLVTQEETPDAPWLGTVGTNSALRHYIEKISVYRPDHYRPASPKCKV